MPYGGASPRTAKVAVGEVSADSTEAWTRPPDWSSGVTKDEAGGGERRGTAQDITTYLTLTTPSSPAASAAPAERSASAIGP